MKKLVLSLFVSTLSVTAFANDQISVTVNGKTYVCSDSGTSTIEPVVVSTYCECSNSILPEFRRIAVMSNGSTKVLASQSMVSGNGSFNPDEVKAKCNLMVRQCGH